jgi:hypothetical protein
MSLRFLRTIMAAIALCWSAVSHTAPLVSYAPNQVSGTNMSFALVAENFSIAGPGPFAVTSLQFWSLMSASTDYRGSVYWAIYSDAPGEPDSVLFSGTASPNPSATGNSSSIGYAEYLFDFNVSFSLAGDTTYWLALQNAPLGSADPTEMLWGYSDDGLSGNGQYKDFQLGANPDWLDAEAQHAFAINGDRPNDVPAPATLLLALTGLFAARVSGRNGKQAPRTA